jgi:hypothetical protein
MTAFIKSYRRALLLVLVATCLDLAASADVLFEKWFLNLASAPIHLEQNPNNPRLQVMNRSQEAIRSYTLGCIYGRKIKPLKTVVIQTINGAVPPHHSVFLEALDYEHERDVCLKLGGKVAITGAVFADGARWRLVEYSSAKNPVPGTAGRVGQP